MDAEVVVVGADGEALSVAEMECLLTDVIAGGIDRWGAALRAGIEQAVAATAGDRA